MRSSFVQTITAGVLRELSNRGAPTSIPRADSPDWMVAALLATAVLGVLCLLVALVTSSFAWRLRKERALNPDDLTGWIRYAKADNPQVGIKLTEELAKIYKNRLDANESRSNALRGATGWVLVTAAVVTLELVLALMFTVMQSP